MYKLSRYFGVFLLLLGMILMYRSLLSSIYTNRGYLHLIQFEAIHNSCKIVEITSYLPYPNTLQLCDCTSMSQPLSPSIQNAHKAFLTAVGINSSNALASLGLGRAELLLQQPSEAILALNAGIQQTNHQIAYLYLAEAYRCVGDGDNAINAYIASGAHRFSQTIREARDLLQDGKCRQAVDAYRRAYAWSGNLDLGEGIRQEFFHALACDLEEQARTDTSNIDLISKAGFYWSEVGEWDRALPLLWKSVDKLGEFSTVNRAMVSFELGRYFEEVVGDSKQAIRHYRVSLQENRSSIMAFDRLMRLYDKERDKNEANQLNKFMQEIEPDHLINTTLDDGWKLVGVNLDNHSISEGGPIFLILFWNPPNTIQLSAELPEGWFRSGDNLVQVGWFKNSAPNGGFEGGKGENSLPMFYYKLSDNAPYAYTKLIQDNKTPYGHVLTLATDDKFRRNGIASGYYMPADKNLYYLMGASVKTSDHARGYIGIRWILDSSSEVYKRDWLMGGDIISKRWIQPVELKQFPFQSEGGYQIWLLNDDSDGQLFIDDIFLVPIASPARNF